MLELGVSRRKRILVSGANGLLGAATLEQLAIEHEVTALVRKIPLVKKANSIQYIEIDLSGDWDISQLPNQMDSVIHVAQSNRYKDFPDSALEVFNVNLTSTIKLLEYGRIANIDRFVLASTGGLYAENRLPLNENSALFSPDKLTHYLGTKLASEIFATNYRAFFEVDILRIFFMYGPGQKPNMLIPRLITSIKNGEPITLAGEKGIRLNPIFVGDVVSIIQKRIDSTGSEVFNVAGKEVVTLKDLSVQIGKITNQEPRFVHRDIQPDLVSESARCDEILEGSQTNLKEGLSKTIAWLDGLPDNP